MVSTRYFSGNSMKGGASAVETFASWLNSCEDIITLKKIHACTLTSGHGDNIYLGTKLLNSYAMFGTSTSLGDSRSVFSKIVNRNPSLWTCTIVGYFRSGHLDEVCDLYIRSKRHGVCGDSGIFTFSLKSCTALGMVKLGRTIHASALRTNFSVDKFVGSSLVGFYGRCGSIKDARQAFDEILHKDVVAYTTMITSYAQSCHLESEEAFDVVIRMHEERVSPNRVTLVSLMQAAARGEAYREGQIIHCYSLRRGITDEVLTTCLIDMYIRCNATKSAMLVFRRMEERSVVSWNAMISSLVDVGHPYEALRVFNLMKKEQDWIGDEITLANAIMACNDLKWTYVAKSIHAWIVIRHGMISVVDLVLTTALIATHSDSEMKMARALFDALTERDAICYNVLLSGYLRNGFIDEAIPLMERMVAVDEIPLNSGTLIVLLSAFAQLSDLTRGKCIHGYALRRGFDSTVEISNQILIMYAKCGHMGVSRQVFEKMMNVKDLVSWTSMISGYVHCGQPEEAIAVFRRMQRLKIKPDSVTFVSLLQAVSGCYLGTCSINQVNKIHGLIRRLELNRNVVLLNCLISTYSECGRLDIGKRVFDTMPERKLTSWNAIIAAYGIHGHLDDAIQLFDRMKRENVKPDGATFTSLLSGCSHSGRVENGRDIFLTMTSKYSIAPNEEHLACMVDLLARAGHVEEAYHLTSRFHLKKNVHVLTALMSACRVYGHTDLGKVIGKELIHLQPGKYGNYTLASNMCAFAGEWSKAADLRNVAADIGLAKQSGFSISNSTVL